MKSLKNLFLNLLNKIFKPQHNLTHKIRKCDPEFILLALISQIDPDCIDRVVIMLLSLCITTALFRLIYNIFVNISLLKVTS